MLRAASRSNLQLRSPLSEHAYLRYGSPMETTSIHIIGNQATQLMRLARKGEVIAAEPTDHHVIPDLGRPITGLGDLRANDLVSALGIGSHNPLKLLVPSDASRCWARKSGILTKVLSTPLPAGAFLELKTVRGNNAIQLPSNLRVFVSSPAMLLVDGASAGRRKAKDNPSEILRLFLRLLAFADECCGWYYRDPFNPATGSIAYDDWHACTRLTNPTDILLFLQEARNIDGLPLARMIAPHIIDGSGSPMETFLNHALTLPPRYAGLSMPKPLANKQLVLTDGERRQIDFRHESLRPDLQWPDFNTLVEYLGDEEHSSRSARVEDKNRMQDYAVSPYTAFMLMYDDVRSAAALGRTALMLANEFSRKGARKEAYRVRALLANPTFQYKQNVLMATLLPPIMRYQ